MFWCFDMKQTRRSGPRLFFFSPLYLSRSLFLSRSINKFVFEKLFFLTSMFWETADDGSFFIFYFPSLVLVKRFIMRLDVNPTERHLWLCSRFPSCVEAQSCRLSSALC